MYLRRTLHPCHAFGIAFLLCACELHVASTGKDMGDFSRTDAASDRTTQGDPASVRDIDAAALEPTGQVGVGGGAFPDAASPSHTPPSANAAPDAATSLQDAARTDGAAQIADGAADAADLHDAADGAATTQTCDLSASFATEILFDVSWNQTTLAGIVPLLAAGTGTLRVIVRLDLGGAPESASARLTACSAVLPDFKASNVLIGTEYYGAYIQDGAWDQNAMPHPVLGLSFGCALPGCALTTDLVVATFGARSGPDDVWPGRSGSLKQIVPLDHDADGHSGITFVSHSENERNASGMSYTNIPVTWTLTERAKEADIAFRLTGLFSGKLDNCDLFTGLVASGSVEARALGCRLDHANASPECSSDQSVFLDQNLPDWVVRGGSFRARRIADQASCAEVRAAFP